MGMQRGALAAKWAQRPQEKRKIYKKNFCEAKTKCDRFMKKAKPIVNRSNKT
jgi:hypothetical protein